MGVNAGLDLMRSHSRSEVINRTQCHVQNPERTRPVDQALGPCLVFLSFEMKVDLEGIETLFEKCRLTRTYLPCLNGRTPRGVDHRWRLGKDGRGVRHLVPL